MAMIEINGAALKERCMNYASLHGTTLGGMSRELGYNSNFLSITCGRDSINTAAAKSLETMFGIDVASCVGAPKDEWDYRYEVQADNGLVKAWIFHNEEIAAYAYARIKLPQTPVTIAQAISYAAHMCYKKLEQEELEAL